MASRTALSVLGRFAEYSICRSCNPSRAVLPDSLISESCNALAFPREMIRSMSLKLYMPSAYRTCRAELDCAVPVSPRHGLMGTRRMRWLPQRVPGDSEHGYKYKSVTLLDARQQQVEGRLSGFPRQTRSAVCRASHHQYSLLLSNHRYIQSKLNTVSTIHIIYPRSVNNRTSH